MSEKQNAEMREALESIINAKEPKPEGFRQPDDGGWRFYALEMKRVAEVALHAAAPSRCDRCGSSGDVFVLCSGCHGPIPSPHPRGEPVAWRFRLHGDSGWVYTEVDHSKAATSHIEIQPLYAAPPPAGADAARDLTDKAAAWDTVSSARQSERRKTIEKVVDILRRRAAGYDGHRATAIFNGRIIADELRGNAREIEALADALPAPQPQEKPTGDQT